MRESGTLRMKAHLLPSDRVWMGNVEVDMAQRAIRWGSSMLRQPRTRLVAIGGLARLTKDTEGTKEGQVEGVMRRGREVCGRGLS